MKKKLLLVLLNMLIGYLCFSQNVNLSNILSASTFIGSNMADDDYGPSMLIDDEGFVYLCGFTTSGTFPVVGNCYDSTYNGGKDVFVAKFSPDLLNLLASTYIGGSSNEIEATMAFDKNHEFIYISGYTSSSDFPVTSGSFDTLINGGSDVFVLKINKNLDTISASSFLGGSANEGQQWPKLDIAINNSGNVCIAGLTSSSNFPIISGVSFDTTYSGASVGGDAFVVVLNENLSELVASTYIGGSSEEWRMSIAVDTADNFYVSGETTSNNFPFTTNAYNPYFNGASDIFICKFNSNLSQLITATSLGKSNYEEPLDIFLGRNNQVYVSGYTKSTNFPTTMGAFSRVHSGGDRDGYIAIFNNNLNQLIASSFLGGSGRDDITAINTDAAGNIYVTGNTTSNNFPFTHNTFDTVYNGGNEYGDAFVTVFTGDLSTLLCSSYLGGGNNDRALDINIIDTSGLYIAGYSKSFDFPYTSNAYDTTNSGIYGDCFISKFIFLNTTNIKIFKKTSNEEGLPKIEIFPNPGLDLTNIQLHEDISNVLKIEVYSSNGMLQKAYEAIENNGFGLVTLDFSQFPAGSYFLKFYFKNNIILTNKYFKI